MTDTWQKACARIFEDFAIERPRLTFFGVDVGYGDCGDVVDVFQAPGKVSPIKCELAPQKPGDYGWTLGRVTIGTPRSGKESTMREWNREVVP